MENDVVLVTGAGSGIGRGEAQAFYEAGARVVLADIDLAAVTAVAEELGENALAIRLDVTDKAEWASALAVVEDRWGVVTVLVNNAGIFRGAPLTEQDVEGWRRIMDINLVGHLLGIQAVHRGMKRNGGGVIINTSSTAGMGPAPGLSAYGASKWAIRGLTRTAAVELADDNIRVNVIVPGIIATPAAKAAGFPDVVPNQPIAALGQPRDIAAMAVFLASPEARYITGAEFLVDGGANA
ncbi:SDR family oxidoreductase [Streptomyces sp. NPDC002838]|uniref:SDR family NAD(P)-dependent oxidoreductase n=1 Tax=Streptomyces sp. NPDC002838 TaxID=3154436 RepID=UPI00331F606B